MTAQRGVTALITVHPDSWAVTSRPLQTAATRADVPPVQIERERDKDNIRNTQFVIYINYTVFVY